MPFAYIGRYELELIEKARLQKEVERITSVIVYFAKNPLKLSFHKEPSRKLATVSDIKRKTG